METSITFTIRGRWMRGDDGYCRIIASVYLHKTFNAVDVFPRPSNEIFGEEGQG